jgi:uncharacterized protein with HEPN domain
MNKKSLRVQDYLNHILDAIHRIERYTGGKSFDTFSIDEQCQDAVIRNIEIIGEAARNIDRHAPDFARRHPEVPWTALYAMRNRITHGYWTVDLPVVWQVVERDLAILEQTLRSISENENPAEKGDF